MGICWPANTVLSVTLPSDYFNICVTAEKCIMAAM